jgi:hypothetical protein
MGGSVVVRTCPLLLERKYRVGGVAVLDVVEGTSIFIFDHLSFDLMTMDRIGNRSTPSHAQSLERSTRWIRESRGSYRMAVRPYIPFLSTADRYNYPSLV